MTIDKFVQGLEALLDQTKKMNAESCDTLGISPEDVEQDPAEDNSIEDDGSDEEDASAGSAEDDMAASAASDDGTAVDSADVETSGKKEETDEDTVDEGHYEKMLKAGLGAVARGTADAAKAGLKAGANVSGKVFKAVDKSKMARLGIKGGIVYAIGSEAIDKYFDNGTAERLARDENAKTILMGGINFLKTEDERKTYADVFAKNYQGGLSTDQCKELALSAVGKTKEELDAYIEMSKNAVNNMTSGGQNGFGWKDAAILGGVAVAAPIAVHYGKKLYDKIRGSFSSKKKTSKRRARMESIELCEDDNGQQVAQPAVQQAAQQHVSSDATNAWLEQNKLETPELGSWSGVNPKPIGATPTSFKDVESGDASINRFRGVYNDPEKTPEEKALDAKKDAAVKAVADDFSKIVDSIKNRPDLTPEERKSEIERVGSETVGTLTNANDKGEYGLLDKAKLKGTGLINDTRTLISKNPLAAAGIAAGAGALASSLMGRKRRREEGTDDAKAPAPKVLVGHGNPLGKSISPVETDEGLLQIAGQIVGGALGATAGAAFGVPGNTFGSRIASGALSTAGTMAGSAVGQTLEPEESVQEGVVDSIKKGWKGTKEILKNNAKLILPVAGSIAGLAYGVNTNKEAMTPAYTMVGGLAGTLASQALEATDTKPSVVKDFNDFKSWKLNKYGC